jgi:hypothetical protein
MENIARLIQTNREGSGVSTMKRSVLDGRVSTGTDIVINHSKLE